MSEAGSNTAGRRALICGVGGQDGAYLAALLLEKAPLVSGSSHDAVGSATQQANTWA